MSEKKYTFSREIAESLGITEAIILDFFPKYSFHISRLPPSKIPISTKVIFLFLYLEKSFSYVVKYFSHLIDFFFDL